jgi:hypothetical protein
MRYYQIINNLFYHFEALMPKILPPDLKTFVYFFFAHPLVRMPMHFQDFFTKTLAQISKNVCQIKTEHYFF